MSEAAEKPAHRPISEEDIEILLASANAIQRLINERNALRSRVVSLECELERLQHQAKLIVDNYRRLTTEYISQFQLIDNEGAKFLLTPSQSSEGVTEASAEAGLDAPVHG